MGMRRMLSWKLRSEYPWQVMLRTVDQAFVADADIMIQHQRVLDSILANTEVWLKGLTMESMLDWLWVATPHYSDGG